MKIIHIDGSRIENGETFHDTFAETFGFPEFYGRNMDAWIDCMTNLDEKFNRIQVASGEVVCIALGNASIFKAKCPELFDSFVECSAFVNWRRLAVGEAPILMVSFNV